MSFNPSSDDKPLNILVICGKLPYPPDTGFTTRLFNLYSRIGNKHRLTWISPIWEEKDKECIPKVETFCNHVIEIPSKQDKPLPNQGWRYLLFRIVARLHWERLFVFCFGYVKAPGIYWLPDTPERVAVVNKVIQSSNYDLIVSDGEWNAELIDQEIDIPKLIVLHNILSSLFKRIRSNYNNSFEDKLFYWPELLKIMRYEKHNYPRFDAGIVVSDTDRLVLEKLCPALPVRVIPNGVDLLQFKPDSDSIKPKTLLYIGHFGYPPNADAMLYFCREIFPIIRQKYCDVQTIVVGHQPPKELTKYVGVKVVGSVPDVRPYLAQAEIVIVPLRVGGGTRLKILEAMAMGKAIVSTTLGAEGLGVTNGKDILLADEPDEFAESVIRVLDQPDLRVRLERNGRKLVELEYSWDTIAERLELIFQQTVSDHKMG